MPHPLQIASTVPIVLQRRAVIAACAVASLVTVIGLAGPAVGEVIYRLLTDGLLLVAWLAAAAGWGGVFFRDSIRPLKFVSAIALGLGILGLLALLLGLIGILNQPIAFVMFAVGLALGAAKLLRSKMDWAQVQRCLTARGTWAWLWLAGAPIVGIALLAALAPPGLLWGDEPHAYDVLEYHLQIPREWYEAGGIQRLEHNVFGYFPQGVEIHFLLAMHLRGGPWAGMYLAQLMQASMTLLAAAAVFATASAIAPRAQATVAGLAALAVPWVALLAPMAYNEGGLLLYGALAIGWTLHATRESSSSRDAILAGAFAGLACGAKLTAGPILLLGLPVAAFVAGLHWKRCLIIPTVGLLVFAPWAIRTAAWSGGNPVFPEANEIFGSPQFTQTQQERWARAHAPAAAQRSIPARFRAAANQILLDWKFGYLLLPVAVAAIVLARRRPQTRLLAILLLVLALFWLFFTHLQGRFFVLAIPITALLLAQIERRALVAVAATVVVVQALLTIGLVGAHPRLQLAREAAAFGLQQMEALLPQQTQDALASGAPIELLGDAQAFRYPVPMSRLRYRTVFDVKPAPATAPAEDDIVAMWLGAPRRPGAYIILDTDEWLRLSKTYWKIPPPPFVDPNAMLGGGPVVIPP